MISEKNYERIKSLVMIAVIIGFMVYLGSKDILGSILLGLLALNLVVLIHETGHYLVAKRCGVGIQVFSIGMGPRLLGWTHKGIDYRISALPLGGYVRMDGESLFEEALKNNDRKILEQPGSLFGTSPWRRIAIAVAGAGFNVLSAVFFFFIAYLIGFSSPSDKCVAPISYYYPELSSPAADAGIEAGDILISANGNKLYSFQDLSPMIQKNEQTEIKVLRDNQELNFTVVPESDDNGNKKIGIIWLLSNEIAELSMDSPFRKAGLLVSDKITHINETPTPYISFYILSSELEMAQEKLDGENIYKSLTFEYERNGNLYKETIEFNLNAQEPLGISFAPIREKEGGRGFFPALAAGFTKPGQWIIDNFKGLFAIASDPDRKLKDSAAGPIGITAGVGMTTLSGFEVGFGDGIANFFMLTAVISSIIAIMNLLPLPALDGGMVLFTLVEVIRRKRFSPKVFYYYQLIGFLAIMGLGILILYMDILNIPKYF